MERVVRERMTTQDVEAITPQTLINIRPVVASIKEFFGTSQLSQFMDQTNPLAGLTHKRRLSALGPGGLSRERAGFEVRDVHPSHYGRMCPIETPEGPNIGLIGSLASYARVNPFGFVETPYRKVVDGVVTDQIDYLTADEEDRHVIAQANTPIKADGSFATNRVLVRRKGGEVDQIPPDEVDYMDVSARQMMSVATAMIPFLEHDDANRALMGSNMQRQSVPLLRSEAPLVGTGMEYRAATDAGDVILAEKAGVVEESCADYVTVMNDDGTRTTYHIQKFRRSNQGTCFNQKPIVDEGQRVEERQVLADGPCTDAGRDGARQEPARRVHAVGGPQLRGRDHPVAAPRPGRRAQLASTSRSTRSTPGTPSWARRRSPGTSRTSPTRCSPTSTSAASSGSAPRSSTATSWSARSRPRARPSSPRRSGCCARSSARRPARSATRPSRCRTAKRARSSASACSPARTATSSRPASTSWSGSTWPRSARSPTATSWPGRHGNKGVISKILPVEDMPFLADGTPVDIVLNPLGVPGRMNVGQVLETHLGWVAKTGWQVEGDDEDWKDRLRAIGADASVPEHQRRHPGLRRRARGGDHRPARLHPAEPGRRPDDRLERQDAGCSTAAPASRSRSRSSVGYIYILKLLHLVDDKIHARSTGPYSMITQQPLGGKAQFGGQRFGEMEVWALEAYGAAYALQELLTIKSDDVLGRVKVYEAIVKGENVPEPGIPESFKVLIKEMQSLCLNVEVLSSDGAAIEMRDTDEDVFRAAEELGIDLSRREPSSVEEV